MSLLADARFYSRMNVFGSSEPGATGIVFVNHQLNV